MKRLAKINENVCVCCGACQDACPRGAISTSFGRYAVVDADSCVGCGLCARTCPTGCINLIERVGIAI
jgi:ferredoxin